MEITIVKTFYNFGHNFFKKQLFWPFFIRILAISYEKNLATLLHATGCTKLRKQLKCIMECFYCFTVAIGLPGHASDCNKDKRPAVAARIQNKVVVE